MRKVVIKVENLSKVYKLFDSPKDRLKESLHPFGKRYSKDFYALRDVSFEVKKGECIGLLGKNGAGKSTLLKILTGVLTPSSGDIMIDGKISALLELGGSFNPELTGMQNIYLNGTLMGYSKEEIEAKIPGILSFADIGDFIEQPVKMYSSGMFARLAFAVSVNVNPDILIIDEVLAVGDLRFQMKCMDKMKELMSGGTTVLFVSHDINAVRRLCGRAIWFEKGKIMIDGDVNAVGDRYMEFINKNNKDSAGTEKKASVSIKNSGIAEITAFRMIDKKRKEKTSFQYNEEITIEVEYLVNDDKVSEIVLGVALYDCNDRYICGLNTLLDNIKIPWEKGANAFSITYPSGLLVLGGRYYFDTALEDKTATVLIHHIKAVKEIKIESPYVSEGLFTIPHKWRNINGQV
jgi:lipopolysaccharide transport system ATP-binding protein/teichoic acid transport system ATP-binding protein